MFNFREAEVQPKLCSQGDMLKGINMEVDATSQQLASRDSVLCEVKILAATTRCQTDSVLVVSTNILEAVISGIKTPLVFKRLLKPIFTLLVND